MIGCSTGIVVIVDCHGRNFPHGVFLSRSPCGLIQGVGLEIYQEYRWSRCLISLDSIIAMHWTLPKYSVSENQMKRQFLRLLLRLILLIRFFTHFHISYVNNSEYVECFMNDEWKKMRCGLWCLFVCFRENQADSNHCWSTGGHPSYRLTIILSVYQYLSFHNWHWSVLHINTGANNWWSGGQPSH